MPGPARSFCTFEEHDSDSLRPTLRFAQWRETGLLPMIAEPVDAAGRERFRIRVKRLAGPAGRFVDVTATPMKLSRRASDYGHDRLDMISLTLFLGTPVACGFGGGAPAVVRPGEIWVKDFTRPSEATWQNRAHRGLNLHLPRLAVEATLGDNAARLHGRALSPSGLAPMLRSQLVSIAKMAPRAGITVRAAALDAAVDLALGVLRCELGVRLEDEASDGGLFAAAKVFIARHLDSPRLCPGLIARQMKCSRAHLYRVFAGHGETIAGYVREQRLRRAYSRLAGSAGSDAAIGEIAYRCGFEDPVHFSRLFRERFGLTPSAFRAAGDLDPPGR